MIRWCLTLLLVILPITSTKAEASGLSSRDIIALAKAGLGEEVLLALVEVDGGVFTLDPDTLTRLKDAGVSERVIVAMIRSGRTPVDPPAAPVGTPEPARAEPQVIVIEHDYQPPIVQQVAVPVAVPVYVPVVQRVPHRTRARTTHAAVSATGAIVPSSGFGAVVPPHVDPHPRKQTEPVYWGWGGKLRPDAWKPHPDSKKK